MQAYTAVAITVLVMLAGRSFWLYAKRRAGNRRRADTSGGTDTGSAGFLISDTGSTEHLSSASTHDSGDATGSAGGSSGDSGGDGGGGGGGSD